MRTISASTIIYIITIILFFFLLAYLLSLLLRVFFRLLKIPLPGFRTRLGATICQVFVGIAFLIAMELLDVYPILGIVLSLGAVILSGFFIYKLFFKLAWKQTIKLSGLAAAFQIVILPIVALLLLFGVMVIRFILFPIQFSP